MSVLVVVDHDRGAVSEETLQALTLGRSVADQAATTVHAVAIGEGATAIGLGGSVDGVHVVEHPLLDDFAPEAWGASLFQLLALANPTAVVAPGSERGNEVLAHLAAEADLPMVANVTEAKVGDEAWELVRVRWGGSLLERADLLASVPLMTAAPHAFPPADVAGEAAEVVSFIPELEERHVITRVVERTTIEEGITLATAPVVVSGGRGVGGPEHFAPLEELAALLGGAVGCSRVVTNNGWRSHSDQVGQTGTRVAPDLYIACGISGAIQHWVGMMASKHVLAINTDPGAPMVTKADFAVIGDLHEIVPAIVAELRARHP